jgi:hypothetical protein
VGAKRDANPHAAFQTFPSGILPDFAMIEADET